MLRVALFVGLFVPLNALAQSDAHLERGRDVVHRMATVMRAMTCAPPGTFDSNQMATLFLTMATQFVEDTGQEEYWRGWIRGAMDTSFRLSAYSVPPQGSPDCRALLGTAARFAEETWARMRQDGRR